MTDVTRILSAIEQGDPSAAEQLLPLVYEELRKLAAQKMAQEKPGQTLQADVGDGRPHRAFCRPVSCRGDGCCTTRQDIEARAETLVGGAAPASTMRYSA